MSIIQVGFHFGSKLSNSFREFIDNFSLFSNQSEAQNIVSREGE